MTFKTVLYYFALHLNCTEQKFGMNSNNFNMPILIMKTSLPNFADLQPIVCFMFIVKI